MTQERENEIQREVWSLLQELRELHSNRTGHDVWTHRRNLDTASRCFTCTGVSEDQHPKPASPSDKMIFNVLTNNDTHISKIVPPRFCPGDETCERIFVRWDYKGEHIIGLPETGFACKTHERPWQPFTASVENSRETL